MQKYAGTHAASLKSLADKISQDTVIENALKSFNTSQTSGSATNNRTSASPDWDGQPPKNWRASVDLSHISISDFDAGNTYPDIVGYIYDVCLVPKKYFERGTIFRFNFASDVQLRLEASANLAREPTIQVVCTTLGNLWLLNRTASKVELKAGEIFGFNVGTFCEVPPGRGFIKIINV